MIAVMLLYHDAHGRCGGVSDELNLGVGLGVHEQCGVCQALFSEFEGFAFGFIEFDGS